MKYVLPDAIVDERSRGSFQRTLHL